MTTPDIRAMIKTSTISAKSNRAKTKRPQQQQADIRVGPYDIICGRTSNAYNNIGNRRFRVTIRMFLQRYQDLATRADRKGFIHYLTGLFRNEIGFRFLKKVGDDFQDIGEIEARKKIVSSKPCHDSVNHEWVSFMYASSSQGHALLDQTVKHNKQESSSVVSSSTSGSTKVSAIKKAQSKKTVPKSSSSSPPPSAPANAQTTLVPEGTVRRVSILSSSSAYHQQEVVSTEASVRIVPRPYIINEEPKQQHQVSKSSNVIESSSIQGKRVSKLESEICFLLLGLQKNQDNKDQQTPRTQEALC